MSHDERALVASFGRDNQNPEEEEIREIHALTPLPQSTTIPHRTWETSSSLHSHRSISLSEGGVSSENFTTMSREFNALVLAGSSIHNSDSGATDGTSNLGRIREEELVQETNNPFAIVTNSSITSSGTGGGHTVGIFVLKVKKEEVDAKINAWQNAKIAKINNRFKREEAIISGWESDQVQKANSWMKKVERKLEAKRVKALEKMQNDIVKAQRKAEERKASAEANRGTKLAKVLDVANLMRAIGKAPVNRSFF